MPQYTANPGYRLIVRDEVVKWQGDRKIILKPVLYVDFGEFSSAVTATDVNGSPITQLGGTKILTADISGGFIDTDELAEARRLDPEDKQAIEEALADAASNTHAPAYGDIRAYEPPKLKAPWSTYDGQTEGQVFKIAEETGFVSEAIQYESRTKQRPELLKRLHGLLTQDAELTAA